MKILWMFYVLIKVTFFSKLSHDHDGNFINQMPLICLCFQFLPMKCPTVFSVEIWEYILGGCLYIEVIVSPMF
jgi:hypothetical protein